MEGFHSILMTSNFTTILIEGKIVKDFVVLPKEGPMAGQQTPTREPFSAKQSAIHVHYRGKSLYKIKLILRY